MGLDMYLKKHRYFSSLYRVEEGDKIKYKSFKSGTVTVTRTTEDDKEIKEVLPIENPNESLTLEMIVLYWRKANAIHKWFVDNVQDGKDDCGVYSVDVTQLEKLLKLCKQVKDNPKDAPELLPTCSGFFFGATEYDKGYMSEIEYTIKSLEKIIKEHEKEVDTWFTYRSSW